jgi:DNA-binding NtrC family response regulator
MRNNPAGAIGECLMRKKILVCDDEKGVRESLKLILSYKYDIVFAENGERAIEEIEHNSDIKGVLLDIKMPSLNGIGLLKYIKKQRKDMPVIVVTGYQSVETAAESLNSGAINYITKPFASQTVIEALEQAIS